MRWRLRNIYMWTRYGPKFSICNPIIFSKVVDEGTEYEIMLSFSITNRDNYPLKVKWDSTMINLQQQKGREILLCRLPLYLTPPCKKIPPHKEAGWKATHKVLTTINIPPINTEQPYLWGIQGINVELSGAGWKELHKGIFHKL